MFDFFRKAATPSKEPSPAPDMGTNELASLALDALPCLTLVTNSTGMIVYASKPATRLLGWHPDELLRVPVTQFLSPLDEPKLRPFLSAVHAGAARPTPIHEVEVHILNRDKRVNKAMMSAAQFNFQGQLYTSIALRFAPSEQRELRLAREQAILFKQANDSKSRFVANLSHEIRTPLNSVLGMIDLLASTTVDSQQRTYLHSLRKSARDLRVLVDDVLDFSKIEAGLLVVQEIPFDLAETLKVVVQSFKPLADKQGVDLKLEMALDQRAYLGDRHRLAQVLNNLLSNALKFTSQGSVEVTAYSRMLMGTNDRCRITVSVTDTGIGISAEQQEGVFKLFHQASPSISSSHGGSGLGLFICRELVELMGGKISLRSQPGAGSTFEFWLDLEPIHTQVKSADTEPPAQLEPLVGACILIVEDDPTNQALLAAWLQQAGALTTLCNNGQEALEKLTGGVYYDAVLMDVSMPVMDGLTATRRIRQPNPQDSSERQRYMKTVAIIGISGHAFTEDRVRCLEAGMTDVLIKPLSRVMAMQTLAAALENSYANKDLT